MSTTETQRITGTVFMAAVGTLSCLSASLIIFTIFKFRLYPFSTIHAYRPSDIKRQRTD